MHDRKRQRYRYTTCKQTFSARRGTMLEGLRKPTELIVVVVTLIAYGCPIQAIVHAFGVDERTVASWRDRAGLHCQQVHQALVPQGQHALLQASLGGTMLNTAFIERFNGSATSTYLLTLSEATHNEVCFVGFSLPPKG